MKRSVACVKMSNIPIDAKMTILYKMGSCWGRQGGVFGLSTAKTGMTMQGDKGATKTYTATEARKNFADIFDAAHYGEKVLVQKRDRCVAVVSMEFIERVERLLEIEAALEAEAAQLALNEFYERGGKTMDEIEQELDMS